MKCYVCQGASFNKREGQVRDLPELEILECQNCSLVFLSSFEHIDQDFYKNSGMHDDISKDYIKKWIQETSHDDERRFDFLKQTITGKTLLDFGCGTGNFLQKTKAICNDISGIELEKSMQKYYKSQNLNVYLSIDDILNHNIKYDYITAWHVVEHLPNPSEVLAQLKSVLSPEGGVFIEVPSSEDALITLYKCTEFLKFTYWSCHLFLFNPYTLSKLIELSGLKVQWVKQIQRYSLANHLHWLAKGKPGGHSVLGKIIDSPQLNELYAHQLASVGKCDTLIAFATLD